MAQQTYQAKRFQGLSDYSKEAEQDHYLFGQAIDYRTDPQVVTLLPASLKESGNVVTDLLQWADTVPCDLSVYSYGNTGNLYRRTPNGTWSFITRAPDSNGNGLAYFNGDDYVYYTTDTTIGRYGPICGGNPQFNNDFLASQGSVPQNTASLLLASASTQYATAANSASLDIVGNLSLETYFKANSLPTVGNSMTLLGKWDESGTLRSYKLDLFGVSGYFGTGADGALVISVNTTEAPIDSTAIGTSGTQTLTATNASFAANQIIFIHQTQGTNAGKWERNTIQSYTAGTITTTTPLSNTYTTGAQVRVVPQYTNVTINTNITYKPKDWNGTVGGILTFIANGTLTVTGNISANGTSGAIVTPTGFASDTTGGGFRGSGAYGTTGLSPFTGKAGEGTVGPVVIQNGANGNGAGGGFKSGSDSVIKVSGSGGGNGTVGTIGSTNSSNTVAGVMGAQSGSADLTTITFGGGGSGGIRTAVGTSQSGSSGGGIIFITATIATVTGSITANGGGDGAKVNDSAQGGGGAGGSILLKAQTATLGTALITANGGLGGTSDGNGLAGGNGGDGRIHLDYLTSFTGTTLPTLNATQDPTLVTTLTQEARLGISANGTVFEYLVKSLPSLTIGTWNRLSVSWVASTSTATWWLNAVNLGTSVGTLTSISNNASLLYVGANKTSVIANYFDGLLNDMRIWNINLTDTAVFNNLNVQLTSFGGVAAYYKFNSAYTDASGNANTLTPVNAPVFVPDVPFSFPTTRLDIDQTQAGTGSTYAVPTAPSQASTDQLTFTPGVDPQKSVQLNISAKGTGNWTVTVYDSLNNVITSVTVANALLPASGMYEFVFPTPWRIVLGRTYHIGVTSTVGDGVLVVGTLNNLNTAAFTTFFQFLVTDSLFHPLKPFLNFLAIGNERYVATWDGAFYQPNFIALPPQTHVRCFSVWREFLAIGTWKEVVSGNPQISDWNTGTIYFWDGISQTFNFLIEIPEGQINAMFGTNSTLYMYAGYRGDFLSYQGSYSTTSGGTQAAKIKRIPFTLPQDSVEIYPGAMTMWRSLLYVGVAANTNSNTIKTGTYSWGTLNRLYPETMGYDYVISTGNQGNTVKIGLVYPIGQTLLVGWQDGSGFGADQINFNNKPAAFGTINTLIQDNNVIWNQKISLKLKADFLPLRAGEGITLGYKINRNGAWTTSTNSTLGNIESVQDIPNGRGREYQYRIDLTSVGNTSPTLLGLSALFDDGVEEQSMSNV